MLSHMSEILGNPRVRELLAQAQKALELHSELKGSGLPASEVETALNDIYRDIGMFVVRIAKDADSGPDLGQLYSDEAPTVEPAKPVRVPEATPNPKPLGGYTTTESDEDDEDDDESEEMGRSSWYTEEVDIPSEPLFDPGDLGDDHTEIPESDPVTDSSLDNRDATFDPEVDGDDYDLATVARVQAMARDQESPLAKLQSSQRPTWAHKLDEFVGIIGVPGDLSNSQVRSEEATRLQWATSEIENRTALLPPQIKTVLLGMLGARAMNLRYYMAEDFGVKLSLDRLRRFRLQWELPSVESLTGLPRPEYGNWDNDFRQWLALVQGPSNP